MNIGDKINDWTIVAVHGPKGGDLVCQCVCGVVQHKLRAHIVTGHAKSCGCLQKRVNSNYKYGAKVNGKIVDPTYHSWQGMKNRCRNPKQKSWENYGGRGIIYDPRWELFENFLADMGQRPAGLTLERKDNNGNYEPGNCCWATRPTQRRNSRTCLLNTDKVRVIRYGNDSTEDLAARYGVSCHTIKSIRACRSWKEV